MKDAASTPAKAIAAEERPKPRGVFVRVKEAWDRLRSGPPARVVDEARVASWGSWDEQATRTIHGAFRDAQRRGHSNVQAQHLALSVLQDASVAAFIKRVGADTSALSENLESSLEALPVVPPTRPTCSPGVTSILETSRLHCMGAGRAAVRPVDLLAKLLQLDERTNQLFAAAGFSLPSFLAFVSHGVEAVPQPRDDIPAGDELEIWLHNDDFTVQELVVEILENDFALSKEEATRVMLAVHMKGRAVAASRHRDEAIKVAQAAHDRARVAGAPMLVTLRASNRSAGAQQAIHASPERITAR